MYDYLIPDLFILIGARALLSAAGITTILLGTWLADRVWDEHGYAAIQKKAESENAYQDMKDVEAPSKDSESKPESEPDYKVMEDKGVIVAPGGKAISQTNTDTPFDENDVVFVNKTIINSEGVCVNPFEDSCSGVCVSSPFTELDTYGKAKVYSLIAYAGWFLLALSYLLDRDEFFAFDTASSVFIWPCFVWQLILGFIQNFVFRRAIQLGVVAYRRVTLASTLGAGFFLSGILTSLASHHEGFTFATMMGAICLMVAPIFLYKNRKMGETWEKEGQVNPNQTMFNFGGPLTAFGWFWFWVGVNSTSANSESPYILPFYFTTRAPLAFIGSTLIIVIAWMAFYAMDEFPDYEKVMREDPNSVPGFGVAGIYFGQTSEVKLVFSTAWLITGIAAFLPDDFDISSIILFFVIATVGFALSGMHEAGMAGGDWPSFSLWGKVTCGLAFVMILLLVTTSGVTAALLCTVALLLSAEGLYLIQLDRKRGHEWMLTAKDEPEVQSNSSVFSFGPLIFTLGMTLFGWGMSIPA